MVVTVAVGLLGVPASALFLLSRCEFDEAAAKGAETFVACYIKSEENVAMGGRSRARRFASYTGF